MYSTFTEQKMTINSNQLKSAAGDTWDSFVKVLPYILIIFACIIVSIIIVRFYNNVSKISKLGQE